MATIGTLLHSPEESQSACTADQRLRNFDEEEGAHLLELRTGQGVVYVFPSCWQRIRLRWIFRYFRVLPPQVLSRRDQRLIETLLRSAIVTPALPVAGNAVLGVIENVFSRGGLVNPGAQEALAGQGFWDVRDVELKHWRALGALAAACIAVVLAAVYRAPLLSSTVETRPVEHAVLHPAVIKPAAAKLPAAVSLPTPEKPKRPVATTPQAAPVHETPTLLKITPVPAMAMVAKTMPEPAPVVAAIAETMPEPAPTVSPAASQRPFVEQLPAGYFAHPVVPEPNLVGELQLKAVIGADGSVKQVTVLSGNPKLAEAGMRAVRQWHYNPYLVLGNPVEVNTRIKMSFFGQDAVSVASVADGLN